MPTKIAIVAGLSGAGKTTLLTMASKGYKTINIGDIMENEGIRMGLVRDRDELKRLPHGTSDMLRHRAYMKFAKITGNIILDTHTTIEKEPRLEPALPHTFINNLKIRSLIYVNAQSKEILARREKDRKFRPREVQDASSFDLQRMIDLAILGYLSTHLNVPLYVINNNDGRKAEAATEMAQALKESFSN